VRKVALISLALLALVVAGCGGGGSSSSVTTTGSAVASESPTASGPEAAWAKEVTALMSQFENHVSAEAVEKINTTTAQALLEPLFKVYGANLIRLAAKLEATKAPAACVAVRGQLAAYGRKVGELYAEMGEQQQLTEKEFDLKLYPQRAKISRYGGKLTELAADLHC
jgi:ABC-type glycerol-3-phosphate transport system substrate-binding protein